MSLPETAIKATRCPKCDAEVRDGSAFCYNCGGRVIEGDGLETSVETSDVVADESAGKPAPGLRSARDIRRRERSVDRKPREVVWEPAVDKPDWHLIIVTAGIIVFTIVVVLLVVYSR
jgi:hypothetical protein